MPHLTPKNKLRGWEFFERARVARQKVADLGAKHSHSSGYGEHLQRRAGAFSRDERARSKGSQPLRRAVASTTHRVVP